MLDSNILKLLVLSTSTFNSTCAAAGLVNKNLFAYQLKGNYIKLLLLDNVKFEARNLSTTVASMTLKINEKQHSTRSVHCSTILQANKATCTMHSKKIKKIKMMYYHQFETTIKVPDCFGI